MCGGVVSRDPEHRNAEHLELREVVGELARFGRAAGRVVFGVEVDDVRLSLELFVRDDRSRFVGQRKFGGLVAGLELHHAKGTTTKRPYATNAVSPASTMLKTTPGHSRLVM